jgi:hypothetical protein
MCIIAPRFAATARQQPEVSVAARRRQPPTSIGMLDDWDRQRRIAQYEEAGVSLFRMVS